jgi:hypothetical protein
MGGGFEETVVAFQNLHLNVLADASWFTANLAWIVAALIVVFGLLVAGWNDVRRFSLKRAWAISGVCFDESVRKRVLWIIPLTIAAVLVVTQFLRALDEQDAIRQTVKICLFATGLVVMLTSMILACTNLPNEIESRVIYTIVTKPVTRLELTLGKVIGFSRVSLTIVAIMGLLTWGYMRLRAHEKGSEITHRLTGGDIGDVERTRLTHYQETGLLGARDFALPQEMAMYRRAPDPKSHYRVISGDAAEDVLAGFAVDRGQLLGGSDVQAAGGEPQGAQALGLVARVTISTKRTGPPNDQQSENAVLGPAAPEAHLLPPRMSIDLCDEYRYSIAAAEGLIGASTPQQLLANIQDYSRTMKVSPMHSAAGVRLGEPRSEGGEQSAYVWVPPAIAGGLANHPGFFIRLMGVSANVEYQIGPQPVRVFIPKLVNGQLAIEEPGATELSPLPGRHGEPMFLVFRGGLGIRGEQSLKGGPQDSTGVAVYSFRDSPLPDDGSGRIDFEMRALVERSNSDVEQGREDATTLDLQLIDLKSGKTTSDVVQIDSQQTAFFSFPADALSGPDFDIVIHCRNEGHTVGFYPDSLKLVQRQRSFELNLAKSLCIIWMMSVLVVSLAVLCSTFLSWPIAMVLTMVLLLGHWGVDQLADTSGPGLGRQIVNDFKFTDAPVAKVVSSSVDALSGGLKYFSKALPDTSRFEAIEDIEQGVSVPTVRLIDALEILAGFALPATIIAYLILKTREVAP